jgi:hypothetical protein
MSNLKGETVILAQILGLLSFRNTSSEVNVTYPKKYYEKFGLKKMFGIHSRK